MCARAVECAGADLPALLGLQSTQSDDGVAETGADHKILRPGGYEITWGPGAIRFDLVSAPSGHFYILVDDCDELEPRSGGLPPKQLALLAACNDDQNSGATDGR
eukprot:4311902-Pyramimonas_sp.AAC.1